MENTSDNKPAAAPPAAKRNAAPPAPERRYVGPNYKHYISLPDGQRIRPKAMSPAEIDVLIRDYPPAAAWFTTEPA
jgi:hypothetical protein